MFTNSPYIPLPARALALCIPERSDSWQKIHFVVQDKDSDIFDYPDNPKLCFVRDEYLYPDVPEGTRIEVLHGSLASNQYNMKTVDSVKTVDHLCEFSGMEISILMNIIYHLLIIIVPTESAPEDQDSPVINNEFKEIMKAYVQHIRSRVWRTIFKIFLTHSGN